MNSRVMRLRVQRFQGAQVTNSITIEPDQQQGKCMEESDGGPDVFRHHLHPPSPGMGQNRQAAGAVPAL